MRSLSDILSSSQNIATALNQIGSYLLNMYNTLPITQLAQSSVGASISTIYTSGGRSTAHINQLDICNTTTGALGFYLHLVPANGTATAANAIFYNQPIPANTTISWSGTLIMPVNGTIQVRGSAVGITVTVTGGATL